MTTVTLVIAFFSLVVGSMSLWANPKRFLNRGFFVLSVLVCVWLLLVRGAAVAGQQYLIDQSSNPVPWLRANNALAAFFPWMLWLLLESVVAVDTRLRRLLVRSLPWLIMGTILATLCFSDLFIPSGSTPGNERRGPAYNIYFAANGLLYVVLLLIAFGRLRKQTGVRKIELQFLTINGALGGLAIIGLSVLSGMLGQRSISRLSPVVILVFYAFTAWAVTIHRVFDARQVFLSVSQRAGLVVLLTMGIFWTTGPLESTFTPAVALLLSIAVWSTLAFWLHRKSREWLGLSIWQNTAVTRQAALEIARREPDPNKLIVEFESLLRAWCQTNYAALLFDSGEVFAAGDIEFAKDRSAYAALCKQGWTTPESLQRLRPERGLVDLRHFLSEFNLGLVVTAPRGSPAPSLLLAAGVKVNHRPFTYPEVQQLQEIAEFMDNILARSRLSRQARQSEQLATIGLIGASLAHEIRNPLVSIKTFSSLLPSRFDDPEFRRRFSVLIPAEVERIDSLTQQLLDLSNPRRHHMDRVSLHKAVEETYDLMLARAQHAGVTLTMQLEASAPVIWADASAIRQVLINLLINAFQALENTEGERIVQIQTRNLPNGSVILDVADNGPGIPPDQRARLFHPFVSTKTKGMGLGLAVCADILHEHRATIIVADVGSPGATFRITFPCPPPSS
jgi:signal transduction histidine kinase